MENKVLKGLKIIASLLMMVLTAVAILAVFWRLIAKGVSFINGSSFYWANEFQLLMLHWVVVVGMAVVYLLDRDIRITMFFDKFSPVGQKNMRRVFNLLDIFVFTVVAVFGGKLAIQEWGTPTSSLMWSRGMFVYTPYVLLGVFVVLYSVYALIQSFRKTGKEN